MPIALQQHLKTGAALRYREGFGFYVVQQGKTTPVNQAEAETAVRERRVRPEGGGPDKFGVYHFAQARA
jgi:hypothetical protein